MKVEVLAGVRKLASIGLIAQSFKRGGRCASAASAPI
jgi:hypothetical protein